MTTVKHLIQEVAVWQNMQAGESPTLGKIRATMAPKIEIKGGVAIIPVRGFIVYAASGTQTPPFAGVEDSRNIIGMVNEAASNPDVKGILLRMDTPGGMMGAALEIAGAVSSIRQTKPVIAYVEGLCLSLGYMIASQANEIVANKSAVVGSIGVVRCVGYHTKDGQVTHSCYFKNKEAKFKWTNETENCSNFLTTEQRAHHQALVDSAFSVFKSAVISGRPRVNPEAMQAQQFRSGGALAAGLIDSSGSEDFAIMLLKTYIKR